MFQAPMTPPASCLKYIYIKKTQDCIAELKEIFAAAFFVLFSQVVDGTSTQESMLKCALKTCSCAIFSKQINFVVPSNCVLSIAVPAKVNVKLHCGKILKI